MNTKVKTLALAAASGVAFALLSGSPASAAVNSVTAIDAVSGSTVSSVSFHQPSDAATVAYTYAYKLYPNGNPSGAQPPVAIAAAPDVDGNVMFDIADVCTASSGSPVVCTATTSLVADGNQYRIQIGSSTDGGTTWTWTSTTGNVKVSATGLPSKPTITANAGNAKLVLTAVMWAVPGLDPTNSIYPFTRYEYSTDGGTSHATLTWDGSTLPLDITKDSMGVDIVNDTTYGLNLRAVNSKGTGPWSEQVTSLTPRLYSVPTAPVVSATQGTVGGTVVLHLDTASVATGATLVGYQWASNPDCSVWSDVFSFDGSSNYVATVAGGSSFSVCVRGVDDHSPIGYSAASTATTPVTALTLCRTVRVPSLVYSMTSKNLTPAGRRVLGAFATAYTASDCSSLRMNTVVRTSKSVAFNRAQKRFGASRNAIVVAYLVSKNVPAGDISSSVTSSKVVRSLNRTSFAVS